MPLRGLTVWMRCWPIRPTCLFLCSAGGMGPRPHTIRFCTATWCCWVWRELRWPGMWAAHPGWARSWPSPTPPCWPRPPPVSPSSWELDGWGCSSWPCFSRFADGANAGLWPQVFSSPYRSQPVPTSVFGRHSSQRCWASPISARQTESSTWCRSALPLGCLRCWWLLWPMLC